MNMIIQYHMPDICSNMANSRAHSTSRSFLHGNGIEFGLLTRLRGQGGQRNTQQVLRFEWRSNPHEHLWLWAIFPHIAVKATGEDLFCGM